MKQSSLLFLLVIIVFVAIPSYGLPPERFIIIRKCPDCWKPVRKIQHLSDRFGTRIWTDGKIEAPMLPDRLWLVKCPHCSALFWEEQAEEIETVDDPVKKSEKWKIPGYRKPYEGDYYKMLNNIVGAYPYDKKKEKYLRIRAWWATNDRWRYFKDESKKKVFSPSETKNLEILYELLDEKIRDEKIMKAEVARELGWFEKSISLLKNLHDENLSETVLMIRTLAEKKNSGVQEITKDEPRKGRRW